MYIILFFWKIKSFKLRTILIYKNLKENITNKTTRVQYQSVFPPKHADKLMVSTFPKDSTSPSQPKSRHLTQIPSPTQISLKFSRFLLLFTTIWGPKTRTRGREWNLTRIHVWSSLPAFFKRRIMAFEFHVTIPYTDDSLLVMSSRLLLAFLRLFSFHLTLAFCFLHLSFISFLLSLCVQLPWFLAKWRGAAVKQLTCFFVGQVRGNGALWNCDT